MSNRNEIKELSEHLTNLTNGVYGVTTYSPGDGVTRYRIGTTGASDGLHDYFGDRAEVTALGASEALVMLQAFIAGYYAR